MKIVSRFPSSVVVALILAAGFHGAAPVGAQLPAGETLIPAGFQLMDERDTGGTQFVQAKKSNDSYAKGWTDEGIELQITWSMNPMAGQIMGMMAQAPADPDKSDFMGTDVSCGHEAHEGGILDCRMVTRPFQEMGDGEDLVTYHVRWMGASDTGLIGVEVSNLFGGPGAATAWIDAMIPKLKGEG